MILYRYYDTIDERVELLSPDKEDDYPPQSDAPVKPVTTNDKELQLMNAVKAVHYGLIDWFKYFEIIKEIK